MFARYLKLLLILLLLSTESSFASKMIEIEELSAPDDIAFFDENGKKHFTTEFDGKTLLLTFWATWCANCVQEMHDLDVLQKDFRKLPFVIIAVSQDFQGLSIIKEYFKNNDIRYLDIYHDYHNQLFRAYSVVGLPTSFLINQEGKIVLSFIGTIDWYNASIRQMILSHIPGDHPEPKNSYKKPTLNKKVIPFISRNNDNIKTQQHMRGKNAKSQ